MPNLAVNKTARSDYEFLEVFEGGLKLSGAEVKSAKAGNMSMRGSHVSVEKGELWLKNMHIGKYAPAGSQEEYDPTRPRKVLVHKRELQRLIGKTKEKGLTIVPIRVYTKGALVKLEFALARGKAKHEKREQLKKRDIMREAERQAKDL